MMNRHPAGANRIAMAVIGLVLAGIGVGALIRGLNLYSQVFGDPRAAVVDQAARAFAHRNTWFWVALAAAMFVIVTATLYWIAEQFRRDALHVIRCEPDPQEGTTNVSTRGLSDALRDDLCNNPGLRSAHAKFVGDPVTPRLHLQVTVDPSTDPAAAKDQIRRALRRLRGAIETERIHTMVSIRARR
jgi:hypothetical protein